MAESTPDHGEQMIHARAREWRPGRVRLVVVGLARLLVRLLFAPQILGVERVPSDGAVLLVANHRSLSDGVFQATACPRPLRWMGMAELFRTRLSAAFFLALGAFPVRRGSGDALAIETARELLERGQAVAIYPEGRLQYRAAEPVGQPHSGAGRLSLETGAQLLPMAMVGTDRLLQPRCCAGAAAFVSPLASRSRCPRHRAAAFSPVTATSRGRSSSSAPGRRCEPRCRRFASVRRWPPQAAWALCWRSPAPFCCGEGAGGTENAAARAGTRLR